MSFAVQAPASDFDIPFVAVMFTFFRTLGQSLGLAISGNIFQTLFRHAIQRSDILGPIGKAEEWSSDTSSLVGFVEGLENGILKMALVKAYCDALRGVLVFCCVHAGVAMVASLVWTKGLSLDKEVATEQGWKGKQKIGDIVMETGTRSSSGETEDGL